MNFAKYRVQLSTEKKYSSKYEYKYEYEYSIPDDKLCKNKKIGVEDAINLGIYYFYLLIV